MDELIAPGLNSRLTFGGLATGLDTGAIVEALIQADRRPITLLQNQRSTLSSRQQAMQELNTRLLALRDAARAIDNRSTGLTGPAIEEELLAFTATSGDEALLEVEVTSGAGPGSFEVEINQLATTARRVSVGIADPNAALSPQQESFGITVGGIPLLGFILNPGDSLNDVRDAINTHPSNDDSVRADIIFDGTNHRLVIAGTEPGAANDVGLVTTFTPGGGAFIDATPGVGQDAQDAQLTYLGVSITRTSNDITDLVPGVTLRLRGETEPGTSVEVGVARDDEAIEASLQAFVDAYNAVRQFSIDQTQLNPETNRGGVLIGDSMIRGIETNIQSVVLGQYSFTDNPFSTLGQIGISFNADATLALDGETLRSALDQDVNAVRELLSGDGVTNGAATALAVALEPIIDPSNGFLDARDDGFEERIDSIDAQIARLEDRLTLREEFLIRRFSQLESLIATLQSQSGFLSQR